MYAVVVAAISDFNVEQFRRYKTIEMHPSMAIRVSQMLAFFPKTAIVAKPLRDILHEGEFLRSDIEHPFRGPVFHDASSIEGLRRTLAEAWDASLQQDWLMLRNDTWTPQQIVLILKLLDHAISKGEGLVAFLQPGPLPLDAIEIENSLPV